MPVYDTNSFWNYVSNENEIVIDRIEKILTFSDYDIKTKTTTYVPFTVRVSEININNEKHITLKYPRGLTKFLMKKISLEVEDVSTNKTEGQYSEQDVLDAAKSVAKLNPNFEIRDYQLEEALVSLNSFNSLINSAVGSGKDQPTDILIPTAAGLRPFSSLKINDLVFGLNGKPQKVTGIFPQGRKQVYRVHFSDGSSTECGEGHLWKVCDTKHPKGEVLELKKLLLTYKASSTKNKRQEYKYYLPVHNPIDTTVKEFEKDISIFVKSLCEKFLEIESTQEESNNKSESFTNIYCEGSIRQRKLLLKSILDNAKVFIRNNKLFLISYNTTSLKVLQRLIWSLSGKATYRKYKNENIKYKYEYRLKLELPFNPFSEKHNLFTQYNIDSSKTYITKIEKSRVTDTMCISVENKDGMYITENYIPTHNTSVMSLVCKILSDEKILIMNDNDFILNQIYTRLKSFGEEDISWNPGKDADLSKRIVITNTHGMYSRLKNAREDYLKYLSEVDCYIVDEAQGLQAVTWFLPIFYMTNLKHLIGYSGSPFRNYKYPYKGLQDFRLIALIGEPAFNYEMKDTIADNNIAQPYAYFIRYKNKDAFLPAKFKDEYFMKYRMNITYNFNRNHAGKEMLKYLNQHSIQTLASFKDLKPAQNMMLSLKKKE